MNDIVGWGAPTPRGRCSASGLALEHRVAPGRWARGVITKGKAWFCARGG